jgi:hypothetical protein
VASVLEAATREIESERQVGYSNVILWSSDRLQDSRPVALLQKGMNVEVISRVKDGSVVEVRSATGAQGWLRSIELTFGFSPSGPAAIDARPRELLQVRRGEGSEGAAGVGAEVGEQATAKGFAEDTAATISMRELFSRSATAIMGGESFSFGTRKGRILWASALSLAGAAIALTFAISQGPGWLLLPLVLTPLIWGLLGEAYEVDITTAGNVTWSSVIRTVEFPAVEIQGIVRRERVSNGELHSIQVEYIGGSVGLPGREYLFARFKALNPTALVRREKYDDTD